nr:MAG TPA: hypothetical protein [Caudoviricetes sp.]
MLQIVETVVKQTIVMHLLNQEHLIQWLELYLKIFSRQTGMVL